ncbi:hypothetical protein AAEX28_12900 [Lentisphaerota bacterium WC36G]|nr:hypothetical protein LJT99_15720 [Lentisphaerae bacterium WC36]
MSKVLSIAEYEAQFLAILAENGEYNIDKLFAELGIDQIEDREQREQMANRIKNYFYDDERFFFDVENELVQSRKSFFDGKSFLITPTKFEIEKGVLFAGHRFVPFCNSEVFPTEITLICETEEVDSFAMEFAMNDIVPSHMLLGAEQMFDFFIAENAENVKFDGTAASVEQNVSLTCFDFSDIYEDYNLPSMVHKTVKNKQKPYLKVIVKDWEKGIFSVENVDYKNDLTVEQIEKWNEYFGEAIEAVCRTEGNYLEIPDQISLAFFRANCEVFENVANSFENFIENTDLVQISYDNGDTILVSQSEFEEHVFSSDSESNSVSSDVLPEGVSVSAGEVDNMDELLKDIGCLLSWAEIEAYVRNFLYEENNDFESFFNYCFGTMELNFSDEAQQMVFMNYIEDMWEVISSSYVRDYEHEKYQVRSKIIEITEFRLEWFDSLDKDFLEDKSNANKFEELAKNTLHIDSLLQLLNSEKSTLSEEELDAALDSIERLEHRQHEIIND